MLELKSIKKEYLTGDNKVVALKDVSILFRENEFVSILGPSGCGKTTVLSLISGILKPSCGDVLINGENINQNNNLIVKKSIIRKFIINYL